MHASFIVSTQSIDIKPNGDALSRLQLTTLSGVAEFERSLIRERTLLGISKARKAGQHLGRPFASGPTSAEVRKLRKEGQSWQTIATKLRYTVAMARRRAA